jgi:hypothetical protein
MPGPIRNSFMRNWWAVEVRITFLAVRYRLTEFAMSPRPSRCEHRRRVLLALPSLTWPFIHSYVVVGAVVVGGSWYLTRLARGPHSEPPPPPTFCFSNTDSTLVQSSGPTLTPLHGTTSSRMRTSR